MRPLTEKQARLGVVDSREVKRVADFVAIVSRYTKLRRAGRQYVGLCPFHSERTPSFYVDPQRKVFKCFGRCDARGDVFDFVMRAEHCDFSRALRIVTESIGVAGRSSPRSGERFAASEGGAAPSARKAGVTHSRTEHARLVARLDATEARLNAIRAANEGVPLACAAERAACEQGGEAALLLVNGLARRGDVSRGRGVCVSRQRTRIAEKGEGARSIFIRHRITSIPKGKG